MKNCQQIVKITVNLTHDCGVQIPRTPFVETLGVIHVAGPTAVQQRQRQLRRSNGGNGDAPPAVMMKGVDSGGEVYEQCFCLNNSGTKIRGEGNRLPAR